MKTLIVYAMSLLSLGAIAYTEAQITRNDAAYMSAVITRAAESHTPYLKPLTRRLPGNGYLTLRRRPLQRVPDTAANRQKYNERRIVAPGDGYLYSAWWE